MSLRWMITVGVLAIMLGVQMASSFLLTKCGDLNGICTKDSDCCDAMVCVYFGNTYRGMRINLCRDFDLRCDTHRKLYFFNDVIGNPCTVNDRNWVITLCFTTWQCVTAVNTRINRHINTRNLAYCLLHPCCLATQTTDSQEFSHNCNQNDDQVDGSDDRGDAGGTSNFYRGRLLPYHQTLYVRSRLLWVSTSSLLPPKYASAS